MNTDDLLGSGTISGPEKSEYSSLLENSWSGQEPFTLDTGETRTFIEDNDRMPLRVWRKTTVARLIWDVHGADAACGG